ncbi:hypothetical protein F3K40_21000 [Streptomyces sp. LBUM 1478]|nr:hypothetical protein [Streptomyces sp. LBUM 1478]
MRSASLRWSSSRSAFIRRARCSAAARHCSCSSAAVRPQYARTTSPSRADSALHSRYSRRYQEVSCSGSGSPVPSSRNRSPAAPPGSTLSNSRALSPGSAVFRNGLGMVDALAVSHCRAACSHRSPTPLRSRSAGNSPRVSSISPLRAATRSASALSPF